MRGEIIVRVRPGSDKEGVEDFGNSRYLVKTVSTINNQIDIEIAEILSHHLGVPPNRIKLKSGIDSQNKVFQVI